MAELRRLQVNSGLLGSRIQLLSRGEKVTVSRPGKPENVFGKIINGEPTTFEIVANIQPISGKELIQLEEGDRTRQQVWIYTRSALEPFDTVVRDSDEFEVQTVEKWGPFVQARGALKDVV